MVKPAPYLDGDCIGSRYDEAVQNLRDLNAEIETFVRAAGDYHGCLINVSTEAGGRTLIHGMPSVLGPENTPAHFEFETLAEAIEFLSDSMIPETDTDLLDSLDSLATYGFRNGHREGVIVRHESEQGIYGLSAGSIRSRLRAMLRSLREGSIPLHEVKAAPCECCDDDDDYDSCLEDDDACASCGDPGCDGDCE